MSGRAWVGLAITVFFLSSAYARIKKERRSGVIQDYGHPVADSLLLLVSALVLAGALALVFSLVGTHGGGSRYIAYAVLLLLGAGLTWSCI
jgi:hypothetical protein